MEKNEARELIRNMRLGLLSSDIAHSSSAVSKNILQIEPLRKSEIVAAYLPFGKEIDTRHITAWLWQLGKTVCVPVVNKETKSMKFAKIFPKTKLKTNSLGIPEPESTSFVDVKNIDAFLVPGIAFSKNGHRVGSGQGFYDIFFDSEKPRGLKIGIAYGFQVVEKIENEGHDVPMDYVVTENDIIYAKDSGSNKV